MNTCIIPFLLTLFSLSLEMVSYAMEGTSSSEVRTEISQQEKEAITIKFIEKLKEFLILNGAKNDYELDSRLKSMALNISSGNSLKLINLLKLDPNGEIQENTKKLQELFQHMGHMTWLREFMLIDSNISLIPPEIQNLTNLEALAIVNVPVNMIPSEIINLNNLTNLTIENTQISNIPDVIFNLKKLKFLNLTNNNLKEISEEIGKLENLTNLNLTSNQLQDLPSTITHLKKLKTLNLSNNQFEKLSDGIKSLKMSDLYLTGNPLTQETLNELKANGFIKRKYERTTYGSSSEILNFSSIYGLINEIDQFNNYVKLFFSDISDISAQRTPLSTLPPFLEVSKGCIYNDDDISTRLLTDKNRMRFNATAGLRNKFAEVFKTGPELSAPQGIYTIPNHEQGDLQQTLQLDEKLPIGYQIFIPKEPIQAISVHVYGGGFWNGINVSDKIFLNKGIMVIILNLCDLYELKAFQLEMPKDLHEKLHLSIHYFFDTLKNDPASLGLDPQTIEQMKGKRISLFGGSFGGRTAIRHAELYPGTFDGYISHDGSLNIEAIFSTQSFTHTRQLTPEITAAQKWLDPFREDAISKIKDPILLLHNYDDNNVGVQVSTSWYNRAKALGKNVDLYVSPLGSALNEEGDIHKGHFTPTDQTALEGYTRKLLLFLLNGNSDISALSQWRAEQTKIYSDAFLHKQYLNLPIKDKFMAWALRLHAYRSSEDYRKKISQTYEKKGIEIPEEVKPLTEPGSRKSWEIFKDEAITYDTLYDAFAYLDPYLRNNKFPSVDGKSLTDDTIIALLKYHLPLFLEYIQEKNAVDLENVDTIMNNAIADQNTIETYRQWILGRGEEPLSDTDVEKLTRMHYLLRILYIANPSLLDTFRQEKAQDQDYQRAKQEALKELDAVLERQTVTHPLETWKSAVKKVLEKQRKEKGQTS